MKNEPTALLRVPGFTNWAGAIPVLIAFTNRLAVRGIEKVRGHQIRRTISIESAALSDHTLADLGMDRTTIAAMDAGTRQQDGSIPRRNSMD